MKNSSLAKTATSGFAWTFGERISAQLVSLIVSVILARLLSPDEYAIVAIVNIFITISNVFVTSGFGNALIQKKDADEIDFSSTLIFSIGFSAVLYALLFAFAPAVSTFYEIDMLTPVLRIMGLKLIFSALNTVQHAYISRKLAFKKFFFATFIGTATSGILGIVMAYMGFGVWALVAQSLGNTVIHSVALVCVCGWRPSFRFDIKRMVPLFSYGWKLLVSELLGSLYSQFKALILSTNFTPTDLSFYNEAERYPGLFIHNIEASLHKVMFPLIAKSQDDLAQVKNLTRKSLCFCFMLIAPGMFGLAACADTLIELLLTEKWLPCVPYVQIICCGYLLNPVMSAHTRVLKALGKSDIFMRITFIRYGSGFALMMLAMAITDEPHIIVAVSAIVMLIVCTICAFVSKKYIGYRFREQLQDLICPFVISIPMFLVVWFIGKLELNLLPLLLLQISTGVVVYAGLSVIINRSGVIGVWQIIQRFIKRK